MDLAEINNVLRHEDIEGLIASGAPGDEYAPEAAAIAIALNGRAHSLTETDIVTIIAHIWINAFNRSEPEIVQRLPAFQRVAHRLLQEMA